MDENNHAVGLSTNWTTATSMNSGTFRLMLMHQPGIKSETSTVDDVGTDLDITWNIESVTTGLDNLSSSETLVIAPNPASNEIRLITENLNLYTANIEIFNSMGMFMKRIHNYSGVSHNVLPVDDLTPG